MDEVRSHIHIMVDKREEFVIKIGPILKKAMNQQKNVIKDVTYGCVKPSDYEVGEVIGKKLLGIK